MILAVLFMLVVIALVGWPSSMLLWYRANHWLVPPAIRAASIACFAAAVVVSLTAWWVGLRSGIRALESMGV